MVGADNGLLAKHRAADQAKWGLRDPGDDNIGDDDDGGLDDGDGG